VNVAQERVVSATPAGRQHDGRSQRKSTTYKGLGSEACRPPVVQGPSAGSEYKDASITALKNAETCGHAWRWMSCHSGVMYSTGHAAASRGPTAHRWR